jgi:hypothetical protein
MTHPDPSPPGETDPNAERWICACSVIGDVGDHRVKLCRGHQEIVDKTVERAAVEISDLRCQKAGLEAMLCDAQAEIAEIRTALAAKEQECTIFRALLRRCEAALRPFAEAYRAAFRRTGDLNTVPACRPNDFARAAELIPEQDT